MTQFCVTRSRLLKGSLGKVSLELFHKLPTLMALLSKIVRKPTERGPLLCMLASLLLKARISATSCVNYDVHCQTGIENIDVDEAHL